ncbi:MAG: C39 family peptidase [Eubacterium sp.]|nr:C39 family peptidase [Eubacterium sp.]
MGDKKKMIMVFIILPILMVVVFVISSIFSQPDTSVEEEKPAQYILADKDIDAMLLEEYRKAEANREASKEENVEAVQELMPGDNEYDDMIDESDGSSIQADAVSEDGEVYMDEALSPEEEAIIEKAEENARKNRVSGALYYNGIQVVCSMNKVSFDGDYVLELTSEELAADHPLFLQYDPRWANYPYGSGVMRNTACGPTCFSMVITALTDITNASPPMLAAYSSNHGHYVWGAGTAHSLFLQGCSDFGLYCSEIPNTEADMKAHLDNGEMLIISCHYGNFTHSGAGHFIVIYGYNNLGFMVNDPASYDRSCQYWPFSKITGDFNKLYALGKAN